MDSCYVDFCEGFCYFLCDKSCIETLREVNLCFALRKLIEEVKPILAGEQIRVEKFYFLLPSPKFIEVSNLYRTHSLFFAHDAK